MGKPPASGCTVGPPEAAWPTPDFQGVIAPALPDAAALGRELLNFRAKVHLTTGNETYESWRERDHDDLVLSVALACWYGQYAAINSAFRDEDLEAMVVSAVVPR
jgi:hypothetical protein